MSWQKDTLRPTSGLERILLLIENRLNLPDRNMDVFAAIDDSPFELCRDRDQNLMRLAIL
jgi:hypothetical protein